MGLSATVIEEVWNRAIKVNGYDGSTWRVDSFGSPILRNDYGNRDSRYGWVIGRIRRKAVVRDDSTTDLRAIQWQNA
ncbi:MAG: hypothetical protein WD716_00545 [Fimbriimonadaceae bacterium]